MTHVVHSGGIKSFEHKRPTRGKIQDEVDIDDLVKLGIYFTIAFLSDKDPHKILEKIREEWAKVGGNKLWLKDITSFSPKMVFTLLHVRNTNSYDLIASELKRIWEEAQDLAETEFTNTFYE